jgi:hypothetical protein
MVTYHYEQHWQIFSVRLIVFAPFLLIIILFLLFLLSFFGLWTCPRQISGTTASLSTHISNFADIGQCWNFEKRWIAPLMVTYHYVKFYVSIIIHLEVININVQNFKISTDHHFQNGHHKTSKIQHCPISSKFDMWVDYDVPTLKNFYRSPFSKWPPQNRTNSTLSDFNNISLWKRLLEIFQCQE